ncbi:hypothetical protein V6N11_067249 [Hibiscus sabdariffa]|uniref:Uncharacterized protein n=1 Tax=Hibiscus sabdariffa TaxID=183260 RepID=A0ABR2SR51_9ROSI
MLLMIEAFVPPYMGAIGEGGRSQHHSDPSHNVSPEKTLGIKENPLTLQHRLYKGAYNIIFLRTTPLTAFIFFKEVPLMASTPSMGLTSTPSSAHGTMFFSLRHRADYLRHWICKEHREAFHLSKAKSVVDMIMDTDNYDQSHPLMALGTLTHTRNMTSLPMFNA